MFFDKFYYIFINLGVYTVFLDLFRENRPKKRRIYSSNLLNGNERWVIFMLFGGK